MGYCSYYSTIDMDTFQSCCRSLPCTKYANTGLELFFQKSHDFDLTDPIGAADFNIVQIREPIARVFSNFELHIRGNPKNNTKAGFLQFAQREYYYYVAFWAKWVAYKPENASVMRYEDLKQNPLETVSKVLSEFGWKVDGNKLRDAIEAERNSRGGRAKYVEKNIRKHDFYDANWARSYEANLRQACINYNEFYPTEE